MEEPQGGERFITLDDVIERGAKRSSLKARINYETYLSDIDKMGTEQRTLHIVIRVDGRVEGWIEYPIYEWPPDPYTPHFHEEFEERITDYVKAALGYEMAKAVSKAVIDGYHTIPGLTWEGDIDLVQLWEDLTSMKRSEEVEEILKDKFRESERQEREKERSIKAILDKYKRLKELWVSVKKTAIMNKRAPSGKLIKIISVMHEGVPEPLLEQFLTDRPSPSEMAMRHIQYELKKQSYESVKKEIHRAKQWLKSKGHLRI